MYKPLFTDASLSASLLERGHHEAIKETVKQLEKLKKVATLLEQHYGTDAKQNVLQYHEVEYALRMILDYHTNIQSSLPDESFTIYQYFIVNKLNQAERILHEELKVI